MNDVNNHVPSPAARPKRLTVKSLESLSLLSFMKGSADVWLIKDRESRIVYMNETALKVNGLPVGFNVEGKPDSECPAPWAEFAPEFQKQDQKAEESGKSVVVISTQFYEDRDTLTPYYCPKSPLYNEAQECIGTIYTYKKMQFVSAPQYINQRTPSVLTLNPPIENVFQEGELEVIFFALQGLSCKEIAKRVDPDYRAVENKLQRMYQKVGVRSLSSFKEFCREKGFEHYIPPKFLKPGVYFPHTIA